MSLPQEPAVTHMPKVSVIVPVYNVEQYLRRCLDSILGQTMSDWEAICVDDGSPDGSASILAEYAERDSRFRILTKENGGLSSARNAGTAWARGEFVNYVDSDDFIHPQTFELAVALAERDRSDIVSWVPDMIYKRRLLLRAKLGQSYDDVVPWSMSHRYDLSKVHTVCTTEVTRHATNHRWLDGVTDPIRYFYAWRHLVRRELAVETPFVEGLKFEDFPWWSDLMLRSPRVTITQLPLYYYYYNKESITSASTECHKITHWIAGIRHTHPQYATTASEEQRACWEQQCLWAVLCDRISKQLYKVQDETSRETLVPLLRELWDMGVLAMPYNKRSKYHQGRIKEYIGL